MGFDINKAVRFKNEAELKPSPWGKKDDANKVNVFKPNSMPERKLSAKFKVFSEDYETLRKKIFDPGHELIQSWNKVFLVSCLVALFLDPLYFYLPAVNKNGQCMNIDKPLGITVTVFRSFTDLFYILHVIVKFRTAYVAPSSRVFGRGELVVDPRKIAARYLKTDFILDFAAALPLPQIVIWFIIPALRSSSADHTKNALSLIVLFQYFPRLFLIFPLTAQIVRTTGVVTKTAWAGAAYNLLLYMLASHVLGACWYLLALERQNQCWRKQCRKEKSCDLDFLDCGSLDDNLEGLRRAWENITNVWANCNATDTNIPYQFGIFSDALTTGIVSSLFLEKYFYCLWWGLRNLSSLGQNLQTSTYMGETSFAILIAIVGLVLFAHLIGNMQTYLQSLTVRLEEWRVKRRDTEEWMRHRQLPSDLRARVRRYVQYQWVATRGVDEEALLRSLPTDLRRDIQRHLCLNLVRRVPFFSQLDDQLLDAICERLKSALSTEGTYIFREGDPVNEMLFIIRGCLDSTTTDGGRSGFFNSVTLGPGDFCGEELLTWALLPKSGLNLPSSTRNVKALVEVEAFALRAEDLKFVANQFRRLHSKRLQHTFRFYSQQWRAWAACFIQAAWRRHTRRQRAAELQKRESFYCSPRPDSASTKASPALSNATETIMQPQTASNEASQNKSNNINASLGATILASRFAANTRRARLKSVNSDVSTKKFSKLQKPEEPDFSAEPDD